MPHAGSPTLVTPLDELTALRAEVAELRRRDAEQVQRIDALERERLAARIATLEALAKDEFTPTLNEHDDRLDRVEVDVKALRGDIADVKSMQAEALGYLRKFDRALDLGVIDPDPTPNMRGPR